VAAIEQIKMAVEKAYQKGRSEAEAETSAKWLPPMDPKLVEKAKRLEYISLKELKQTRLKTKKKEVSIQKGVVMVFDDEMQNDDQIKWLEYQQLMSDLLHLYLVQGGHIEKLDEMLTHIRLTQRFGNDQTLPMNQ